MASIDTVTVKANSETVEVTVNGVRLKIDVYDNKCTQIKVIGASSVGVESANF